MSRKPAENLFLYGFQGGQVSQKTNVALFETVGMRGTATFPAALRELAADFGTALPLCRTCTSPFGMSFPKNECRLYRGSAIRKACIGPA